MRQWDIYLFPFEEEGPYPAVIISVDERCANSRLTVVNALYCRSIRPDRPAKIIEVPIGVEEGLDRPTAVNCELIRALPKDQFLERRGHIVSGSRRQAIARKIHDIMLRQVR